MLKKIKKILKKGAMSVEYIVIGVCVIGMAALATTFVSNKMSVAMGQENNSGDTNNGGNTGDTSNSSGLTEEECNTNKNFFDTYGLYPGTYHFNDGSDYDSEINVDGNLVFTISYRKAPRTIIRINLKSNEIAIDSRFSTSGVVLETSTGTFLRFNIQYSDKTLGKGFEIYYHDDKNSKNVESSWTWILPKEAYKLGGHEDCSGFRTEKKDFCELWGINYGSYTVKGDDFKDINVIVSQNKIEYNDSTKNVNLIYDFIEETVYISNLNSNFIIKGAGSLSTTGYQEFNFIISNFNGGTSNSNCNLTIGVRNGEIYSASYK